MCTSFWPFFDIHIYHFEFPFALSLLYVAFVFSHQTHLIQSL
jgi:hypothetical protein